MCLNTLQSHVRSLAHAFVVAVVCFCSFVVDPQWGTPDTEIKVSPAENPERLKVLPLKPEVGPNIDMRTSPTATNFFLSDYNFRSNQNIKNSKSLSGIFPCVRCG